MKLHLVHVVSGVKQISLSHPFIDTNYGISLLLKSLALTSTTDKCDLVKASNILHLGHPYKIP